MTKLLRVEPEERISLEEAINHEWFGAIFEKTKQSSKSIASESYKERDAIVTTDVNIVGKNLVRRKRKYSAENLSDDDEEKTRMDRYSK